MDPRIQPLLTPAVIAEGAGRYGLPSEEIQLVGGFQSFLYAATRPGADVLLRFTHSLHRTPDEVRGEVDWIDYLARGGVPVARARPSEANRLVEVVPALEGAFAVTAFERAPGRHPGPSDYGPALFRKMGWLVGRMHALTQDYEAARPAWRRHAWYEDSGAFADALRARVPVMLSGAFAAIVAHLRALPTPDTAYGLVHTDVHGGNLHVHGDGITLFDFDDCQFSWFADDIAMAVFYAVSLTGDDAARDAEARAFLTHFLPAYLGEVDLDLSWFGHLPAFLKAREIAVAMALWDHVSGDLAQLVDWEQSYMQGRLGRIEQGIPFLALDFEALAAELAR
jgi:Ser/Thr protein kinase RdoA (MazF antagonist)